MAYIYVNVYIIHVLTPKHENGQQLFYAVSATSAFNLKVCIWKREELKKKKRSKNKSKYTITVIFILKLTLSKFAICLQKKLNVPQHSLQYYCNITGIKIESNSSPFDSRHGTQPYSQLKDRILSHISFFLFYSRLPLPQPGPISGYLSKRNYKHQLLCGCFSKSLDHIQADPSRSLWFNFCLFLKYFFFSFLSSVLTHICSVLPNVSSRGGQVSRAYKQIPKY